MTGRSGAGTVIVGAGHAGVQLADTLRTGGYPDRVVLLDAQDTAPYQRPPLSKEYLAPDGAPEPVPLRGERFYSDHGIELRPGARVRAIDRAARAVLLDDGTAVDYATLVLATGAEPRRPPVPGATLPGVHGPVTLADARALRAALPGARSAVVVGAGFIGLEFAAVARAHGVEVTVLEAAERPMARVLSPTMSDYFAGAHTRMGTELRMGEALASIEEDRGRAVAAVGATGRRYPADLVLMGVGVAPRVALAREAGLRVCDGVAVDTRLRTSDPSILAIGDCATFPAPWQGGEWVRLESVQNATDQARHAAGTLLGVEEPYTEPPWFWSIQGEHRLQIAGVPRAGDEHVILGDPERGRFSVLGFRGGVLGAVESVNRPADHAAARRVFRHGLSLTPERAGEPGFDLKSYAARASVPG
ncbi:NAD(P)/FAD-dependent oxidoreductase [Halostreptopolyspora alba]|uniref:Pyridine nucleotide-disulfide oxidoreductase n=1 Tax=Halostreptopolyspora alba TaxID=2487137 RepID=A0A3N0EBT2_9ACTN|nr:pyridine nucleotide-disulfide oxidoreductase [Nocardiopsaceae bacterium YIM 96095]